MRLKLKIIMVMALLLAAVTPCRAFVSLPDSTTIVGGLASIETPIPLPYNDILVSNIARQKSKPIPHDLTQIANTLEIIIQEHEMPMELKFLPICLKTNDKSRCGDWDLTPLVAIRYGLTVTKQHDERFATEASTHAALSYIADLYQYYGDWWKSIMAFAYGPATVNKLCERKNITNAWDYDNTIDKAHIVRNFITFTYLYHDKELTPKEKDFLEVVFSEPINFNALADKLKIETSELIELNPIFLGETVFPLGDYPLRLPAEKAELFYEVEEDLYKTTDSTANDTLASKPIVAQAPKTSTSSKPIKYKVKKGDTLTKIAQKHGTTVENLKRLNNLSSDKIREGQLLTVKNVGSSTPSVKASTSGSQEKTTHTIKKGETLGAIAQRYKVTVNELKKWNNLKSDLIREGDKLIIYKK